MRVALESGRCSRWSKIRFTSAGSLGVGLWQVAEGDVLADGWAVGDGGDIGSSAHFVDEDFAALGVEDLTRQLFFRSGNVKHFTTFVSVDAVKSTPQAGDLKSRKSKPDHTFPIPPWKIITPTPTGMRRSCTSIVLRKVYAAFIVRLLHDNQPI